MELTNNTHPAIVLQKNRLQYTLIRLKYTLTEICLKLIENY